MSEKNKIVYFIDIPSVSNGMKRTYHKKLEVFSGELKPFNKTHTIEYITSVHTYKNGEWIEKSNSNYCGKHITKVLENITEINDNMNNAAFATLELAIAAKLILIQRMAQQYEYELKNLQERFYRNVPDVSKPLKQIKESNPEFFI